MSEPHGAAAPRIRESVRALIVDPVDRVLLVRFEFPDATVWALPGGGVEPGEDPQIALHRELDEELGLVAADIGPQVWDRTHLITFDHGAEASRWDGQHDRIYLVRSAAFVPRPRLTWEQLRAERLHEIRWWTLDELWASDGWFAPRRLPEHLTVLLRDGPPTVPLDTGI